MKNDRTKAINNDFKNHNGYKIGFSIVRKKRILITAFI